MYIYIKRNLTFNRNKVQTFIKLLVLKDKSVSKVKNILRQTSRTHIKLY